MCPGRPLDLPFGAVPKKLILPSFLLSCCEKLADVLRFAANRGALLLVVRACFDLTKQMLRETTREGKKRGSVSSSGAPAKRPHAKRALAENGDLRGHEERWLRGCATFD